jgi:hypothetical protein
MALRFDFAPISRDQSIQIRLASAWLVLNAVVTLGLVIFVAFSAVADREGAREAIATNPTGIVIAAVWGFGMFKAGRALSRRSILGGYVGLRHLRPAAAASPRRRPSVEVLIISGPASSPSPPRGDIWNPPPEFGITETIRRRRPRSGR